MIPVDERFSGECWLCKDKRRLMFMDHSVDGYLCSDCAAHALSVEIQLVKTEGIRNPLPGEISEADNH